MQIMTLFSVTQLTQAIKNALEPRFSHVQVKGEVSNLRHQTSGHLYFNLKDQESQISAVLFRGDARHVARLPKDGDQVIVTGALSLYAPRGSYQIIVRKLGYAGVGELLLKLHAIKEKLKNRGWLDQKLKKALPKYPKVIGVVTSPTGSVIQDIIHVLKRRFPHFHLILNPVRVQGEGAAEEIASAIKNFNLYSLSDVLIVGRGGGSLEDIWPFNTWCVAEAIFHSRIPIISAVGHETDVTIADYVADAYAPTPSAAAEIAIKELHTQTEFLQRAQLQINQTMRQALKNSWTLLRVIRRHPLFTSPHMLLCAHSQKIDDLSHTLYRLMKKYIDTHKLRLMEMGKEVQGLNPLTQVKQWKIGLKSHIEAYRDYMRHQIDRRRVRVEAVKAHIDSIQKHLVINEKKRFSSKNFEKMLFQTVCNLLEQKKDSLRYIGELLNMVNPENVLKKGYCIPFDEKGDSVMLSSQALRRGMQILLQFHDGSASALVEEVTIGETSGKIRPKMG